MLIELHGLLSPAELGTVRAKLSGAPFVDGRLSAGPRAGSVKRNEELEPGAAVVEDLNAIVMTRLVQDPIYKSAALPHRVAVPFYARYTPGMAYGEHIDDPVMGPGGGRYRCDVAVTIFLNGPEEYAGGELRIRTAFGTQSVKLAAGDAVLYPASSLHEVSEVTRGERLVAVTWLQSLVRDPARRELLHELNLARESLMRERPQASETARVDHAYVNLVRMWSEV